MLDINSKPDNPKFFIQIFLLLWKIFLALNIFFLLVYVFFIPISQLIPFVLFCLGINFTIYFLAFIKLKSLLTNLENLINRILDNKIENIQEILLDKNLSVVNESLKKIFLNNQNMLANLSKIEQYRTEFLGNVSHELRTPIFAMQGFLETLLNGALLDNTVNRSFVEKAYKHSQNLNTLLNDLIDISMIESGKMRMSFRYFNLSEFLQSVYLENLNLAQRKQLNLILDDVNPKLMVFGDQDRLNQVLNNLIQNAIKYTDSGYIKISTINIKNKVEIIIEDTGIGIPPEDIPRIFERFYRIDKNRSRAEGGTGLGLSIVKHILEAHGEKIRVESTLGKGSKFSFYLRK